jgi:hypothetical protein
MHEIPSAQGHLRVCRCSVVVLLARLGVLVVAGAFAASCVNLSYPPGASRDGGSIILVSHFANGHDCGDDSECASAHCSRLEKVCCKDACDQTCYSCALPGNEGSCLLAPAGTNPHGSCNNDGPESCGNDGVCDGNGGCEKYAAGTTCAPATCAGYTNRLAGRCDGTGNPCSKGQTRDCAPYICDEGGKCKTSCATDRDCNNGVTCDLVKGSCGLKALGTACSLSSECASNSCAQGVCCHSSCVGPCVSCALPGNEGICSPLTAGTKPSDPTMTCPSSDPSTCGLDGTCDGAGACRNYPTGTVCTPASCTASTLKAAGTCDGKTHCLVPTPVSCGGYTCALATPACRTTCAQDADCASPNVCGMSQMACGGLSAQYYRQTNLTDLAFSRTDATINFNWGGGSPSPLLNVDNFSIRWRGKLTPRFTDDYTFYAATDDGERLWVAGKLLIDRFIRKPSVPEDVTAPMTLTAGVPVDIVMEYFESGGDASATLSWSSAKNEPKSIIPTSALSPQ